MTNRFRGTLIALAAVLVASSAQAQYLGPHRQFIALEGYYSRLQLDAGENRDRIGLDGYGGRLWINLAPFSGPSDNLVGRSALALFYTTHPRRSDNIGVLHYGAALDVYFTRTGGFIDPFVEIGGGVLRTDNRQRATGTFADLRSGSDSRFALSPGGGFRVAIPNRLQLRFDGKDVIVFKRSGRTSSATRVSHSPEFTAGIGLTF